MEAPDVRFAWNGETGIAYQVLGDGPLALVYLQGYVQNLDLAWQSPPYERFLRRLAAFSRLILLDRPGVGVSDRMSTPDLPIENTLETTVDAVVAVLDATGCEQAALFGWQDAGFVAALMAATRPERVSAVILYGTAPAFRYNEDMPWAWTDERWRITIDHDRTTWGTREGAAEYIAEIAPSLDNPADIDWMARAMRATSGPGDSAAEQLKWSQTDIRPILPAIRVPTLVLHRSGDVVEPVESGRLLAARIPGAKLVELPGVDSPPWAGDADTIVDEVEEFLTGVRHVPDVETVLAAVLFTDIVGSTERQATLGDRAWKVVVERHHAIVREALARWRGVENDTAGDGFYATFDGPARAIRCALEVEDRVRGLSIEVRSGVHIGECERVDGKLAGLAVSIGARVASQAGASEVLVSQTVKDLVAGSGLTFDDAGVHELKGIPDQWHLFRVVAG